MKYLIKLSDDTNLDEFYKDFYLQIQSDKRGYKYVEVDWMNFKHAGDRVFIFKTAVKELELIKNSINEVLNEKCGVIDEEIQITEHPTIPPLIIDVSYIDLQEETVDIQYVNHLHGVTQEV